MNLLKRYREKADLSQTDVGKILGVTQSQYWKLEVGKSVINATQIIKLCHFYSCTPNDLLGFKGVYKVVGARLDGEK